MGLRVDNAWLREADGTARDASDVPDFHELFEESPEGVFISDVDGRFTDVNPAGCRMLGYSREELLGRGIVDFLAPEDARWWGGAHENVHLERGTVTWEHCARRKDGSILHVEVSGKWLHNGRHYAFVRDVSERKRAERERDEALGWLRAVLDQSPVGLALVHAQGSEKFEFNARAQQLLGPPDEPFERELLGRLQTLDGGRPPPERLPFNVALGGERISRTEFLARNAAGGLTPISVSAGPISGDDGSVVGAVAAFEDISARKELERLRTEWSSVVAHDLRQPLASIALNAQLLARQTDDANVLKRADGIRRATDRVTRMVGDLMDLSRLEARRLELVRQRIDVPALVRAAVERIEPGAQERPFDVRVHGDIPKADADPDRVAQVVENLLTNALKYGKAGTPVVVTVEREGDASAVAVSSEGRPLTAEDIARIFERFQRTASARLEGIQGVGLGLYITRSLVEAHGGHISAESTLDGRNTFRFTLPAADAM
jgi:PAS domain S-box-containing protein